MTISTIPSATTLLGNGVLTSFQFFFIGVAAADITVTYVDTNGSQTVLSTLAYTLTLNAATTGSLWGIGGSVQYPLVGSPIAAGTQLIISRTLPLTQLTTISNQGQFTPQVIEQALDLLCLEIQQVSGRTGQIRGTWATGVTYNYGDIVQDGANGLNTLNYYLCAIENTSGTWATDLAAGDWSLAINVQQLSGFATSAASSAAAAAASATSASGSASTATTQASNASTSASTASTAATTATTQAGIATTQATNASSSASSASTSASTASTAATNASSSASSASTSASNASTSATNAANSAAAAAASAATASGVQLGTSTTSNSIGTGSKTYTTQAGLAVQAGSFVVIANTAAPANYNHGQVTSYSGTTLVVNVLDTGGTGTFTAWTISLSGPQGAAGAGSGTVNSGTAGQVTYYAANGTTVSGDVNLTVSAGAVTHGVAGTAQGSLILAGSTSGTTTLAAPVAGTGTMTLQAGTDTLVGRATTDTLTNKTIDTASNTVKLAGTTITGKSGNTGTVATTTGTLTSGHIATFDANGNILDGGTIPVSPSAAIKSDQQTPTSTTVFVNPAVQQYHPSAAQAWVVATSPSTSVTASYNISSITNNSTGDNTINFTTPFASSSYAAAGMAGKPGTGANYALGGPAAAPTASAYRMQIFSTTNTATNTDYRAVFYGAQ